MTDQRSPHSSLPTAPDPSGSAYVRVASFCQITFRRAKRLLASGPQSPFWELAEVVRALRTGGYDALLERQIRPILAAYEDKAEPRALKSIRHPLAIADASEDCSESLMIESETPANLRRWARDLRTEAALGLEAADAADLRAAELERDAAGRTV